MPSGLFYRYTLNQSISNKKGVRLAFIFPRFIQDPVHIANSEDPDQTPRSAASDLGLHCLSVFLLYRTLGINGLNLFVSFFFDEVLFYADN